MGIRSRIRTFKVGLLDLLSENNENSPNTMVDDIASRLERYKEIQDTVGISTLTSSDDIDALIAQGEHQACLALIVNANLKDSHIEKLVRLFASYPGDTAGLFGDGSIYGATLISHQKNISDETLRKLATESNKPLMIRAILRHKNSSDATKVLAALRMETFSAKDLI